MKCKACGGGSRVLSVDVRERLRECTACRRRWRSVELLQGFSLSEPATAETVQRMRGDGKTIAQIAEALHMSTRTVQEHLRAAPSLSTVWS